MAKRLLLLLVFSCWVAGAGSAEASTAIHTCAVTAGGGLQCWGDNRYGQLGDGTTAQRPTPVQVTGITSGVPTTPGAVAAGTSHSCAIVSGALRCWGLNTSGQLGDTTTTDRLTPVQVSGLTSGVTSVSAGLFHTCAVQGGAAKCWGDNQYGQIGNNSTTASATPVTVIASGVVSISAGDHHTCAVTTTGAARCWGRNNLGQIGDNTQVDRLAPVTVIASGVPTSLGAVAAGGFHTCAVQSGAARCWGYNVDNQLGDGTSTDRLVPTQVSGLTTGVLAVATGYAFSCALRTGGGVQCWGYGYDGQMGNGGTTSSAVPVQVTGLTSGVTSVVAGSLHACAVTTPGQVSCWGDNGWSQIGEGSVTQRLTPAPVVGLAGGAASLTAGTYHMCGVSTGNAALCWGNNSYGELGYLTPSGSQATPGQVTGLTSGVASVVTGFFHSCALLATGNVMCWGQNVFGQLGTGQFNGSTPTTVAGIGGRVSSLAAGEYHTCAVAAGRGVRCWGSNSSGQLGDGTTTQRPAPTPVTGLGAETVAVASGQSHTCALGEGGGVRCWGSNTFGQLGDGTTSQRLAPVAVSGLSSGVAALTAGFYHTCALTTNGGVRCWGSNGFGQLGDGTGQQRLTPTPVSGLSSGVAAIAAGLGHTCALTTGGDVWCWGFNGAGRLGDGTTIDRLVPTRVTSLRDVASISAGQHTCAVTRTGTGLCWGDDAYGQLGMNTRLYAATPKGVYGLGGTIGVTGVTPAGGATTGGTPVTITGDYLLDGATVTIGGTAASGVRLVNAQTLVATTGARAAGTVGVTVVNPGGASATRAGAFTYTAIAPTVTAVEPGSGPMTGGTAIRITGANLLGASVTIGGQPATNVTSPDAFTLVAVTPPGAAGARDVVVSGSTGQATRPGGFTYDATSEVSDLGAPAGATLQPSLSADGRYLAFVSGTATFVTGDTNNANDVFVRDRATGQVIRASVSSAGVEGNGASSQPSISADGRFIAFVSSATNLVAGDINAVADVFLRDRDVDEDGEFDEPGAVSTTRVSVASDGTAANGPSAEPDISPEGRWIAFASTASTLVAGDTNAASDVFLRDRVNGQTLRVSVATGGLQANGPSYAPGVGAGADRVVFASDATNLVAGDGNARRDVFLHERASVFTTRVSVAETTLGDADGDSDQPSVDDAGITIAFQTLATDIVPVPATSLWQVVVFRLPAAAPLTADGSGRVAAGVVDIGAAIRNLVSGNGQGQAGNASSQAPQVSGDGNAVAFDSTSSNLVSGDTNGQRDVFVARVSDGGQASAPDRVSSDTGGNQAQGASQGAAVSGNGEVTGFESVAALTTGAQGSGTTQVFVRGDALLVTRISPNSAPVGATTGTVVEGAGFEPGAQVRFGAAAAPSVIVESATRLIVDLPFVGTPGVVDVTVTNVLGGTATLRRAFTFTAAAPTLTAVSPQSGPVTGGTLITLTGTGFVAPLTVTIGGVAATNVTVVSPTSATAVTPARAAGLVDVTVGGATLAGAFTYFAPPPATDTDSDGMPDSWEAQFGLDPQSSAGANGAAGDPDGDGASNLTEYERGTHPRGTFTRYLAEGASSTFFGTRVALANPSPTQTARALLTFQRRTGPPIQHVIAVPPRQSRRVVVNDVPGMLPAEFATQLESDGTLVMDRLMWWDTQSAYGTHAEAAVLQPALAWYLAEGATHSGFDLFYLLQNPSPTQSSEVRVSYLLPSGTPIEKTYTVDPGSRFNIWVDWEQFPEGSGNVALSNTDVSAKIEVVGGAPIVVERAMYVTRGGQDYAAGHESAGVTAPALEWFLAEGATGDLFDLFLLFANPNATAATATVTYLLDDGRTFTRSLEIPANSRRNIWVDYDVPDGTTGQPLSGVALSTRVQVTNDVPIVVERAMWWPGSPATWHEAHNSPGSTATSTLWGTAEGQVQTSTGTATYLLVANPSATTATVEVTLLFEHDGAVTRTFTVPPTTRKTIDVGWEFPEAAGQRFGALVESVGGSPAPIVVECAMYSNALGVSWAAGSNQLATRLR